MGWLAIAAGVLTWAIGVPMLMSARRQRVWRRVEGVVLTSVVIFDWEYYRPAITFEYTVDGIRYQGDTVRSMMLSYNWRGPAERLCAQYPPGRSVAVFVREDDPSRAVLEPGGDSYALPFILGVGGMLVLIGLAFVGRD